MLTSENPSHPEYLAMLKCIEERRDEKVRLSAVEMQLELAVLRDRAVGERSQIMSQFYQGVREAREKVLEELGQQWYEIQQERRRLANTIPDYGIRFPTSKPLAVKQAVAYNKEVSVLSGFAKHVGFPAAPVIHGVTEEQLENDWEAMRVSPNRLPQPGLHKDIMTDAYSSSSESRSQPPHHNRTTSRRFTQNSLVACRLVGFLGRLGNNLSNRRPGQTPTTHRTKPIKPSSDRTRTRRAPSKPYLRPGLEGTRTS